MAFKNFSGILLDPDGEVCAGDRLRFTQQTITGQVLAGAVSYLDIAPDGSYSIDLQYGVILIDHYDSDSKKWRLQGAVTVNENTKATTLPELLGESTPPTDEQIKLFEDLLAQTKEAAAAADVAALAARASALAAEDSEKAAAASAAEAEEAAAKVAADLAQSIELALQVAKDAAAAASSAAAAAISASDAQDAAIATAKDATAATASSASASKSAIAAADSAASAAISAGQAGDAAASAGSAAAAVALNAQEAKEAAAAAKNSQEIAEYNGNKAAAAKEEAQRAAEAARLSEIGAKGAQEIAAGSAASAMEDAKKAAISAEYVAGTAEVVKNQTVKAATAATSALISAERAEAAAGIAGAGTFFNSFVDAGDFSAAAGEYPKPDKVTTSYMWRCIEAGKIGEVSFSINDFLAYSSKSKEFTRIGGGSGGGAGSSFIDELPDGIPWKTAKYEAAGVDKMGMDKSSGSGDAAWPSRAENIRYKIDKMGGTIKIIFPVGTLTVSTQPSLYFTLNLPTNCKFFDTPYNFELTYTIGSDEPKTKVFATPTSEARGLRIDIPVRPGEAAEMWGQVEWPVLFDGETFEIQQLRTKTSYRQAPLTSEALFDAVAVIASPSVTASNLLYRYPDKTEIRLTGSVDCVANEAGAVSFNIALPTAFNLLITEGTTRFDAVFVPAGGEGAPVAIVADFVGGLLGVSAKLAAGTAGSFIFNTTLPVVRK